MFAHICPGRNDRPSWSKQAIVLTCLVALSGGCGRRAARPGPTGAPADVVIVVPEPPASGALEVVLTPDGAAEPVTRGRTPIDAMLEREPGGAARLRLSGVATGRYTAAVRAVGREADIALYSGTRAIEVIAPLAVRDAGAADAGAAAAEDANRFVIALERAFGAVEVVAEVPAGAAPELTFEAALGPFRVQLAAADGGRLAGKLDEVPTGDAQVLVVTGRDRAGTVLYQGVVTTDVPDAGPGRARAALAALDARATLPSLGASVATPARVGAAVEVLLAPGLAVAGVERGLRELAVDWGDGVRELVPLAGDPETAVRASHGYGDAGPHVVVATLTSQDGHVAQAAVVLDVQPAEGASSSRDTALVQIEALDVPEDAVEVRAVLGEATAGGQGGIPLLRERGGTWTAWRRGRRGESFAVRVGARGGRDGREEIASAAAPGTCAVSAAVATCTGEFADTRSSVGDGWRLMVSRPALWLPGPDASGSLEVRAFDAAGAPVSTDGLDLEWLSTDTRRVAVAQEPGQPRRARVTARVPLGSVQIVARSRVNPALRSAPVTVMVAPLAPGASAVVVPAERVVYTPMYELPPDGVMPDVVPLGGRGDFAIGSFAAAELAPLVDTGTPGSFRAPVVLRGPAPTPGQLLVLGDGVFGRVARAEARDAFALVQLAEVSPGEVFADLDVAYDHEDLARRGLVAGQGWRFTSEPGEPAAGAPGATGHEPRAARPPRRGALAPETPDSAVEPAPSVHAPRVRFRPDCKLEGSFAGVDVRVADGAFNVNWVAIGQLRRNQTGQQVLKLRFGFRARLGGQAVLNLQPGAVGNIKCALGPEFVESVPLIRFPLFGVPVGLDFEGKIKPIWDSQVKVIGAVRIGMSMRCALRLDEVVGVDVNLDTGDATPYLEVGLPTGQCRPDISNLAEALRPDARQLRVELKSGPFVEGKGGITISAGVKAGPIRLRIGTPAFQLLAAKVGGEGQIAWENAPYVLGFRRSGSTANYGLLAEIKLENKELSGFLDQFKVKKLIEIKPLVLRAPLQHQYRPLQPSFVRVDGRGVTSAAAVGPGQDILVTVGLKFDEYVQMAGPDDPPRRGAIWWDTDGRFELIPDVELRPAGPDRFEARIPVTAEMCRRFDEEGAQWRFIAYNHMFGNPAIPTPGFGGSLKLTCKDEVFFTADEIAFPTPDGTNIAIVGNIPAGDCSDLARDVRLVSYVGTQPNHEWSLDSATFKLDGQVLAMGSGGSPLVLPRPGGHVVRDLAPGEHEFSLEYVARKGRMTRNEVVKQRFIVRLKPRDPGLSCDSPTRTTFAPRQVPVQGPVLASNPGGLAFPAAGGVVGVVALTSSGGQGSGGPGSPARRPAGTSSGDPHVATQDGITYSTMTLGEFVYARSTAPGGVEVQMRHGRLAGFADWASFNVAAAVRAGGHVYEVRLPGLSTRTAAAGPLVVLMDGQPLLLAPGSYTIDGAFVRFDPDGGLDVSVQEPDLPAALAGTPDAWTRVRVGKRADNELVRADDAEPVTSLYVSIATAPIDRYRGLLGRPNGRADDELTARDGTVMAGVGNFVESWRVRDRRESLFTYAPGEGPETFNLPQDRRPPTPAELAGAGGGRDHVAEVEGLIRSSCGEDPRQIDPVFVLQQALDMAAGRSARNLLASGLCGDGRVAYAGREPPASAGLTFGGRVTLAGGGGAAAGVNVQITSPTVGLELCRTTTDGEGRYACGYVFERPVEPMIDLLARVSIAGHQVERRIAVPTPAAGVLAPVTQDFELAARAVRVRGRVLGPGGAPAPGAFVRTAIPYRVLRADDAGAFALTHLPDPARDGGAIRLEAATPDATSFGSADVLYDAAATASEVVIEIRLQANVPPPPATPYRDTRRLLTFAGRVLSAGTPPAPLASADVLIEGPDLPRPCATRTGSDGRFACTVELGAEVDALDATVQASLAGGGRRSLAHAVATERLPEPGQARVEQLGDLVIAPTRLRVAGRLTAEGAPVPGLRVGASVAGLGGAATSGADGSFAIEFAIREDLAPGAQVELSANWTGPEPGIGNRAVVRRPLGLLVAGDTNQRTIDLAFTERPLVLTGRVVNELANRQPVAGARVEIERAGGERPVCTTVSDAMGFYRCPIAAGDAQPIAVRYRVSGRGSATLDATVDPSRAPVLGLTPVLRELPVRPTTLRVSGTVERADGQPAAGAQVSFLGELTATLTTSAAGVFDAYHDFADGTARARFEIRATDGRAVATATVDVALMPGALASVMRQLVLPGDEPGGQILWVFEPGGVYGGSEVPPAVAPDGTAYFLVQRQGGGDRLYAVSATGQERWRHDFNSADALAPTVIVGPDGGAWVRSRSSGSPGLNVHAFSPAGARRFTFQSGDPVIGDPVPLADGGALALHGRRLHRISPQGSSAWSVEVNPTDPESGAAAVMPDGTYRAVTGRGYSYSARGAWASVSVTGALLGRHELTGDDVEAGFDEVLAVQPDGSVLAFREYLYEGPSAGLARIAADGTVLWSASPRTRPVLGPQGRLYLAGLSRLSTEQTSEDGLVALDLAGRRLWTRPLDRLQSLTVTSGGAIVAITADGSNGGSVLRAFAADGTPGWTFDLAGGTDWVAPLAGPNGSIIAIVDRLALLSVDAQGEPRWRIEPPGLMSGYVKPPGTFANGLLYFAEEGRLFGIRP